MHEEQLTQSVQQRYHALLKEANPQEWAHAWRSELNRGGFKAVDFLMREVVDTGKCVGCAACVTICPADVFDYRDEHPVDCRNDACVYCELCADVCPVLRPQDADVRSLLGYRRPTQDEGFGPYNYALLARATRPDIKARAQDGGVVTTMLIHALQNGLIQGVVAGDVDAQNPQLGQAKLATTPAELLRCSGSRYTYSPNTLALLEAMDRDVRPLAVVGVPCQVEGMRQQQYSSIRLEMAQWYQKNVNLVIGLFCSESFTGESIQALAQRLHVDPQEIVNINVKGKVVVRLRGGREEIIPLKEYRKYARPACLYCLDYAADHADISVGGIGLDGWTFTVVRTEAGHEAFQLALSSGLLETQALEAAPRSKPLLIKLANSKRQRPLPALMPTLQERQALGNLDPKTFYEKPKPAKGEESA